MKIWEGDFCALSGTPQFGVVPASLKSKPFIPSTENFQGVLFHPCMVYHVNFIILSQKLWKCEQFEKKVVKA